MWQDYVIAAVVAMFALTTIPLIRNQVRVPKLTSYPMHLGSIVLAVVYITLDLTYSLLVELVCVTLWGVIIVQSDRN